jgi:ribosomal protein S7
LKRTRRIEVIRFERRVTWSNEDNALNRSDGHEIDVLLEALGNIAPAPEVLRYETGQGGEKSPPTKAGKQLDQ